MCFLGAVCLGQAEKIEISNRLLQSILDIFLVMMMHCVLIIISSHQRRIYISCPFNSLE